MISIKYDGILCGTNRRYAYRGSKILSQEYKDFKVDLGWLFKAQTTEVDPKGRFSCEIEYNSRHDVDALLKAILDSAEGIVYKNDRQVDTLTVSKNKDLDCKLKVTFDINK